MTFGDSYRELTQLPEAAGSKFLHLNIFFQKMRTKKIEDWTGPAKNPGSWMLDSVLPGLSLS